MKTLFIFLLCACIQAKAATITNRVLDITGGPSASFPILVKPLSPLLSGTNYVNSNSKTVLTDTNGVWGITLLSGDYYVQIGQAQHRIAVPTNNVTYDFTTLINTNGMLYSFGQPATIVGMTNGTFTVSTNALVIYYAGTNHIVLQAQ